MAYTTIDKPTDYFNTKLYTGNGSTQSISSVGFQPDWTWIKSRSEAVAHVVFDSVRGAGGNKELTPNETYAEGANSTLNYGFLSSFNSDGFSVSQGTSSPNQADYVNKSSQTYVSWNWLAGTSFSNDASATSIGSIDSSGSVNETAGFSICTYTGISSAGTIKHGLSTVPSMIIWKNRSASNGWIVYHHKNTSAPETDYLELHATNATNDLNTIMNDTAPTSSVFSIGTEGAVGGGNTNNFVAYIFSERKGYSKFGSYTGNGNADGAFVYTGFKPAFILVKGTSVTSNWTLLDNKRNTFNVVNAQLQADLSNAESSTNSVDFTAQGFKVRNQYDSLGSSGNTYIYMAIAESPFVSSKGIPTTAR